MPVSGMTGARPQASRTRAASTSGWSRSSVTTRSQGTCLPDAHAHTRVPWRARESLEMRRSVNKATSKHDSSRRCSKASRPRAGQRGADETDPDRLDLAGDKQGGGQPSRAAFVEFRENGGNGRPAEGRERRVTLSVGQVTQGERQCPATGACPGVFVDGVARVTRLPAQRSPCRWWKEKPRHGQIGRRITAAEVPE